MSDRPNPSLKATSFSVSATDSGEFVHAVTFNDGSAWTETLGPGWQCQWQPSTPAGTTDWVEHPEAMLHRKIGNLEAERDAWKKAANVARCHESKLEIDLDTARKALDFQVEQRQKLEAEVKAWKIAANVKSDNDLELLTPESLTDRILGFYRLIETSKGPSAHLDPWMVMNTAWSLLKARSEDLRHSYKSRETAKTAMEALKAVYPGVQPTHQYQTRGTL